MPQKPTTVSIAEGDVAATLKSVLDTIKAQNAVCTVLTDYSIKGLGTAKARVELTFDLAMCQEVPPPA